MAASSTSSSLLERVRAKQAEGWRRLVHLYGPLVYQWCRQCGLQAEDVEKIGAIPVTDLQATVTTLAARHRRVALSPEGPYVVGVVGQALPPANRGVSSACQPWSGHCGAGAFACQPTHGRRLPRLLQ